MADRSAIEWTEATWNPVTGCSKVSPGAPTATRRPSQSAGAAVPGHPYEQGFDLQLRPERLEQPHRWTRPRMIFVNSMSDLFHEAIPDEFVAESSDVMTEADWHMFQILTKRHERLAELAHASAVAAERLDGGDASRTGASCIAPTIFARCQRPSASSQRSRCWVGLDGLDLGGHRLVDRRRRVGPPPSADAASIGLRDLRDRCVAEGVAFFFKQWGGTTSKSGGRVLDGRTWDELPHPASLLAS